MSKILTLTANNQVSVKDYPTDSVHDTLGALQSIVGGYIEFVDLPSARLTMIVNEEGKLSNLPINQVASYFFWREYGTSDYIVGDVAFLSNQVNEVGDPIGLDDKQVANVEFNIYWRLEEIDEAQFNNRQDLNEYIKESEGE